MTPSLAVEQPETASHLSTTQGGFGCGASKHQKEMWSTRSLNIRDGIALSSPFCFDEGS